MQAVTIARPGKHTAHVLHDALSGWSWNAVPITQLSHTVPSALLRSPTKHVAKHAVAPSTLLILPPGQALHVVLDGAPSAALDFPSAHATQVVGESAPLAELHLPAPHGRQVRR